MNAKKSAAITNDTIDTSKEENTMKSTFATLNAINVNEHTEKKNGLTYLSWAWAWSQVKAIYPDANYHVFERETEYGPVNYFTDGKTCWVKTSVFINELQHIEMLPVMDYRNRSIPLDSVTSTDVNKAIQRSLTKAIARHGLGLYIYAGEDLPEDDRDKADEQAADLEIKPQKTRVAMVKELCADLDISVDAFGRYRNAAVQNSIVPDMRVSDLSDDDFGTLLNFVRLNAAKSA